MNRITATGKFLSLHLFLILFLTPDFLHAGDNAVPVHGESIQFNLNIIWVLLSAALVFFMQAGFMCLESGLTEAKNSINVAIKNLSDFVIATILFWIAGFGIMFGDSLHGIIGTTDFMIDSSDSWRSIFFVFQAVFVGTAATITSGAVAGRIKFGGYLAMSVVISVIVYPVFGHWAWGGLLTGTEGGWLAGMGFIDFAGSTVVHSVGGWVALAGIIVIGARKNKFDDNGNPVTIQPNSIVLAYLGTFILFLGWFGFNCGSTLEASGKISVIAMNTVLSACWGSLGAGALSWLKSPTKKPQAEMVCNGIIGGLVGITAGCASVSPTGASIIGFSSGLLVYWVIMWMENTAKLDDVVGAVAVHGACGAWGTLAAGIFITPENLGETDRVWQIIVQLIGIITCFGWTFFTSFTLFSIIHKTWGLRVSEENERIGLNVSEHGARSTLLDLSYAMHHVTQNGDYSPELKVDVVTGDEMEDLARGFNNMIDAVRISMEEVQKQNRIARDAEAEALKALKHIGVEKQKAEEATEAARRESDKSNFTMKKLAAEQKKTVEKQEFLQKVLKDAVNLSDSAVNGISSIVDAGKKVSSEIGNLGEKTREIIQIVDMISSIADETNLLSLNASIEAARSYKEGKGFQVIAHEIKDLSRSTKEASRKVAEMIGEFKGNFEILLSHIKNQDEMAEVNSEEINTFHREFELIMKTAGIKIEDTAVVPIHNEIPPIAVRRQ